MTATTETIPDIDRISQFDRIGQDRPDCEAADVVPAPVPPPGEDRWDQEDAGLYGPRGWSVRAGVWHELACCRDDLRSTVIPAEYGHGPEGLIAADGAPQEDYTPFHDLGPRVARRLLEILPAAQLQDRQNLAPTLGALLRACARAAGRVRLSGYGIGPQRPDERVTVEGLWIADADLLELEISEAHDEYCACLALWETVRTRYDLDAESVPDEVRFVHRHWEHEPLGTWLWWD